MTETFFVKEPPEKPIDDGEEFNVTELSLDAHSEYNDRHHYLI